MTDIRRAIQKHLGITVEGESVSYYQLLGVPVDAKVELINSALKVAVDRWNQSDRKSDPEAAKKVATMIKEAQSILLSDDKRRAYDAALQAAQTKLRDTELAASRQSNRTIQSNELHSTSSKTTESSTAVMEKVNDWEDSIAWNAPFDASIALPEYDVRDFGTSESRWTALVSATSIDAFLKSNEATASAIPSTVTPPLMPRPSSMPAKSNATGSSVDRAALLRKKRQRQQIILASGLVGTAFLFLAAAGVYYFTNQQRLAQAKLEAEKDTPAPTPDASGTNDPFLPGIAPNTKDPSKPSANRPSEIRSSLPSIAKDTGPDLEGDGMKPNGMDPQGNVPPMNDMPAKDDMPAKETDMNNGSESNMENDSNMMSDDKDKEMMIQPESMAKDPKWTEAMNKARAAIKKADFEAFKTEIEKALPLSKSTEQDDMYKRLDQLGQLHEIAVTAMRDARKSLRGTETLTVSNIKVNIVEVKEDGLIVRKEGDNITHAWNELPSELLWRFPILHSAKPIQRTWLLGLFISPCRRNKTRCKKRTSKTFGKNL